MPTAGTGPPGPIQKPFTCGAHYLAMRILILSLLLISPALAQNPPVCAPALEGMVACFGEKLCKCNYERGSTMTERPAGFRWDCGVLRPSCGVVPAGPPTAEAPPIFLSPSLQGQPRMQVDPRYNGR